MWDTVVQAVGWLLLVFVGGQAVIFAGVVGRSIWIDSIEPRLISKEVIEREAEAIIANHADPELEVFARLERAWYRSNGAKQTHWRRVRKAIRRRLYEAGR